MEREIVSLPCLPASVNAARVPAWDLGALVYRSCPVCGLDQTELICRRPDGLAVGRCEGCQMVYLPRVPTAEQIAELYTSYADFKRLRGLKFSWQQLVRASLADPHIGILQNTGGLLKARLIEIGCSYGHFLQVARHCGAEVSGVELDTDACGFLRGIGIPVSAELTKGQRADVVCAFQVIEHLSDPAAFVAAISEVVADDGRVLLALPNGGEFEVVGERWVGFRVDLEHLNYFSVKSLSRLLAKAGLFVEQFWLHAQPNIGRGHSSSSFWGRIQNSASAFLDRGRAPAIWNKGTFVLTVLARKVPGKSNQA